MSRFLNKSARSICGCVCTPLRISWRVSHVAARRVPTLPRRHHPRVDSTTAMCVPPHIARTRAFLFRRVNRRALIHHAHESSRTCPRARALAQVSFSVRRQRDRRIDLTSSG